MPIDASIALQGKPPEYEDFAVAQGRQLSLRNLAQQGQLGAQKLQSGQLDLDAQRLALQRDEQFRNIVKANATQQGAPDAAPQMQAPTGPARLTMDPGKVQKLVTDLNAAGLPDRAQKVLEDFAKTQSELGTAQKNVAEGLNFNATTAQKKLDQAASLSGALLNLPPEARAAAYPAFHAKLIANDLVKPGELPVEYPGDAAMHQLHDSGLSAQAQLEQHIKDAAEARAKAKAPAELAAANADAATKTVIAGQMGTLGMTKKEADELTRQTEANKETARHDKADEGISGGRLRVERDKFNATFGSGLDANGQPLSGEQAKTIAMQDPNAVGIANYQLQPPKQSSGMGAAMMRKVMAINPSYDATQFQARSKTAQDFSASGASGKSMTSTDTALAHLDTLSKAGAALRSGDIQALNRIATFVGAQTGGSAATIYDSINSMVAPEISKAVIGAAGGEGERGSMAGNFNRNLSDSQREGNIGAAAGLLGARFQKQAHAYESTMGKPLDRKLSAESQAVLDRYTKPAAAASGSTGSYSQTATGPNGHKIGSNDGKSWFDVQTGKKIQ